MVSLGLNVVNGDRSYGNGIEEIHIENTNGIDFSSDLTAIQRRGHSRYTRDDICVTLQSKTAIFKNRAESVKLINISHQGLAVTCKKKLRERSRLSLELNFDDGKTFNLKGRIVYRRVRDDEQTVGIKFDKAYPLFEEHLLKTGLKLKLRNNFQ